MVTKKKNAMSEIKKRIIGVLLLWVLLAACTGIGKIVGIDVPNMSILGAYLSGLLFAILLYKFPFSLFVWAMIFDFFAVGIGTILNVYRTVDCYDLVVHFLSGILAAKAGAVLINGIYKKHNLEGKLSAAAVLFALFFSFSCAGLWEVYEFSADQLLHTALQGTKENTMGDIIAGMLGGLVYVLTVLFRIRGSNLKET